MHGRHLKKEELVHVCDRHNSKVDDQDDQWQHEQVDGCHRVVGIVVVEARITASDQQDLAENVAHLVVGREPI